MITMGKKVAAIICAAGSSSRFGQKKKKPFVNVAGKAAFLRSVELFTEREDVKQVLLGIAPEDEEIVEIKWGPNLQFFGVRTFLGGKERFTTVANGLALIAKDVELVAIHDAARCCLTQSLIDKVIARASQTRAAILAAKVIPTIKETENGLITRTIDRSNLYEAQTPQVFDKALLTRAYEQLKFLDPRKTPISDDAQLVERLGESVAIVESDSTNMKITYGTDVAVAEAIIKSRPKDRPEGPIGAYEEAQW